MNDVWEVYKVWIKLWEKIQKVPEEATDLIGKITVSISIQILLRKVTLKSRVGIKIFLVNVLEKEVKDFVVIVPNFGIRKVTQNFWVEVPGQELVVGDILVHIDVNVLKEDQVLIVQDLIQNFNILLSNVKIQNVNYVDFLLNWKDVNLSDVQVVVVLRIRDFIKEKEEALKDEDVFILEQNILKI